MGAGGFQDLRFRYCAQRNPAGHRKNRRRRTHRKISTRGLFTRRAADAIRLAVRAHAVLRHQSRRTRRLRPCCAALAETRRAISRLELSDSRHGRPAVWHDARRTMEAVFAAFRFGGRVGATLVSQPHRPGIDALVAQKRAPGRRANPANRLICRPPYWTEVASKARHRLGAALEKTNPCEPPKAPSPLPLCRRSP